MAPKATTQQKAKGAKKGKQKQQQGEASYLVDDEAKASFILINKLSIEEGRDVDIPSFQRGGVADRFKQIGWDNILKLPPKCYYQMVKVFYSNLRFKEEEGNLYALSNVKGVEIALNIHELGERLGVSSEGQIYFWEPRKKFDHLIDVGRTYSDIMVHYTGNTSVKLKDLKPIPHAIPYIVQHNIIPRRGHRERLSSFEAYVTHCIHSGMQLNMPYIILRMMKYAKDAHNRALPYGRLLTQIFTTYGIDLEGEDCESGKNKKKNNEVKIHGKKFHLEMADVGVQLPGVGAHAGVDPYMSRDEFEGVEKKLSRTSRHLRKILWCVDQVSNKLGISDISDSSLPLAEAEGSASQSK